MRILTLLILASSLVLFSTACDDTPAEREENIENAADKTGDALDRAAEKTGEVLERAAESTGEVVNDVIEKTPRVDVDVDVTTRPAATAPATRPPASP